MRKHILFFVAVFCLAKLLSAQLEEIDPEYLNTLKGRTAKIVDALELIDSSKCYRVQNIVIIHYYELSKIHDTRDAKLEAAKKLEGDAKEQAKTKAQLETDASLYKLHVEYIAKLSSELTQDQIIKIKDGMTYGVVDRTYNGYLTLLPNLTDEQKRFIYKNLVEAREFAMDAGSSDEKHAWFGKYKGRINNYLSAAGIDMKKAEEELKARQK
jgi:hypothetical protein